MKKIKGYIIIVLTLMLFSCSYKDKYNLVPLQDMSAVAYNLKLTGPAVNIDTMAYTIVEKQDKFFLAAFDTQGKVYLINDVSNLFTGDFAYDKLLKIEYYYRQGLFWVFMKSENVRYPFKIAEINPSDGTVIKEFMPSLPRNPSVIKNRFIAPAFSDTSLKVFVLQEYLDSLQRFHKHIIKYAYQGDSLVPVSYWNMDSTGVLTVWYQFILNNDKLYFYLVQDYEVNDLIYAFCYDEKTDSMSAKVLTDYFLPIYYVNLYPGQIFVTVHAPQNYFFPAIYDLNRYSYVVKFLKQKYNNYVALAGITHQDTTLTVGYVSQVFFDNFNFANYKRINGVFSSAAFIYNDVMSGSADTLIFTKKEALNDFIPYGIMDNGKGYTIIARTDAFSYFPGVIVLKTDYSGKTVNAF